MLKKLIIVQTIILVILSNERKYCVSSNVVRGLFEAASNSLFGMPVIHKKTEWDFQPNLGEKYRSSFYENHGQRAAKYIERIGLGHDGKELARAQEQAKRDEGRLNGEHFVNFP